MKHHVNVVGDHEGLPKVDALPGMGARIGRFT